MRQFIAADDFNMTVLGGQSAGEMSAVERRMWPYFRTIRKEMTAAARKRPHG